MREPDPEQKTIHSIGRSLVLALAFVLLPAACAAPGPDGGSAAAPAPTGPVDPIQCTPFEWQAAGATSPTAAIRVPVLYEKKQMNFQMNTGAGLSTISGAVAKERGIEYHPDDSGVAFTKPIAIEVGGVGLALQLLVEQESERTDPAGSLGLNVLVGKIAVLDFPGRRFCVVPPGSNAGALMVRDEFTPAQLRDGKLFVEFDLGGEHLTGLFFDTSASIFPLSVDFELWKKLTGREGGEEKNARLEVAAKDDSAFVFEGAPARGTMQIGGGRVETPMVFYQKTRPDHFAGLPFEAAGLIGNSVFLEHVVVLDLRGEPRIGLLASPPEAGSTPQGS